MTKSPIPPKDAQLYSTVCQFCIVGWGEIAIPGPRGGWLPVYVAGPCVGALIGGGLQRLLARLAPKS